MSDKTDVLIQEHQMEMYRIGACEAREQWDNAVTHRATAHDLRDALRAEIAAVEAERAAALQRVDELERERRNLWRQTDANEGTLLTYCAVHAVRWQSSWGEPSCGFIQAEA